MTIPLLQQFRNLANSEPDATETGETDPETGGLFSTNRGYLKRCGGHAGVVEPAREFVTDINTIAGLWPFTRRGQHTQQGTPLGIDPTTGQLACYDPYTAFTTGQQRAAQLAILAANGVGKSLLAKKLAVGFAATGIPTIVPFDTKNEYKPIIGALGGSTRTINRQGGLNLLDPGENIQQAHKTNAPTSVIKELVARRNQLVATIAAISRNAPLAGWEQTALAAAMELLPRSAVIAQLPAVFHTHLDDLARTLNRSEQRAGELLEPLALDVAALAAGPVGQALGTTGPDQRWAINQPLVVDTSAIKMAEPVLSASVITACWTAATSTIYLANQTNTDAGVHAIVFDEIWRATREFPALANQIGGLLRMDRNDGIISIIASHSWTDTQQPGGSNILARCAAFALGGMQLAELDEIAGAGLGLNTAELAEIRRNATGGTSNNTAHGGIGRFLIKQGEHPGQLVQTRLTTTEQHLYNTNQQWAT